MFDIAAPVKPISQLAIERAKQRQSQLTKPLGSLGRLEDIALQFAGWQHNELPEIKKVALRVFAGDHGVTAQGVSAFPQEVTVQMIQNFCSGGAAISVLSQDQGFDFEVWNIGTKTPTADMPKLRNIQIAPGTRDFSLEPAMTETELQAAFKAGADSVPQETNLFIGGEMGIGNTTTAAALMSALFELPAKSVAGRGTGVDDTGLKRKITIVKKAIELHTADKPNPLKCLQRVGGLEIAALTAAYVRAAQLGIPSLVDGFITSVAAAYAMTINPGAKDWLLFAHSSAEKAHRDLLVRLSVKPLLNLEMRLGEASGAAMAVPIIKHALVLHTNMASFSDAGVSEGTD